jgi:hypothetical protein
VEPTGESFKAQPTEPDPYYIDKTENSIRVKVDGLYSVELYSTLEEFDFLHKKFLQIRKQILKTRTKSEKPKRSYV